MRTKWLAAASTISLLAGAAPAWAASDSAVSEVVVTARRLDQARESIQPNLGATSYTLPAAFVDNLPGGENTGLNQVLLQASGPVKAYDLMAGMGEGDAAASHLVRMTCTPLQFRYVIS